MTPTYLNEWKPKSSILFCGQLIDVPIPLPGLTAPFHLFNIYHSKDGDLYTNFHGAATEYTHSVVEGGAVVRQREGLLQVGQEMKTSIHASGRVVGFERINGEQRAHLGFALRDIGEPRWLGQHRLGSPGTYVHSLVDAPKTKASAIILTGAFEQPLQPVLNLHAAPDGYEPAGNVLWCGRTRPLNSGRRIVFAVAVTYEPWPSDKREHELRVFASLGSDQSSEPEKQNVPQLKSQGDVAE